MKQERVISPDLEIKPTGQAPRSGAWLRMVIFSGLLVLTFVLGIGVGAAFAQTPLGNSGGWSWTFGREAATAAADQQVCLARNEIAFYPQFRTFWEAMRLLQRDFYGELPSDDDATYDAIRGVVNELGDPNTSFLTPAEANLFRTNIAGSFEGIGARVEWDEEFDTLRIVEPFENQPAWTAGLKRGDLVLAVDGESVVGTNLTAAVNKVRGAKGTVALLTIARDGLEEPFDVAVTRDRIETPTIATDTLTAEVNDVAQSVAYIKLNTFNQSAGELVNQAVEDAVGRNVAGIVFDLRGNSGGLLREAVKVANAFMEDATILYERFGDGREEVYRTTGHAITKDLPLVVLVNEGSASASEIVAGALQDNGRAKLVGTVTYGKGSVQLPHTLQGGSIMRVTVAHWFTPNDRTIDGAGLAPDVTVTVDEAERTGDADPQLAAALALLLEEIEQ